MVNANDAYFYPAATNANDIKFRYAGQSLSTAYQHTCSEILGLKDALGPKAVKAFKTEILGLKDSFNRHGAFHKVVSEILGFVDSVSSHVSGRPQLGPGPGSPLRKRPPRELLFALRAFLEQKIDAHGTAARMSELQIFQASRKVRIQIVGLEEHREGKVDS